MKENRTLSGPGLTVFDVDPNLWPTDMGMQTKYLLISADSPVSVFCYGFYWSLTRLFVYLASPVDRWSTKYIVGSYTPAEHWYVFVCFLFCTRELELQ